MSTPERRVGGRAEQKRRWDREHVDNWYDVCACGTRKRRRAEVCRTCYERQAGLNRERIAALWAAGASMKTIAADLGWTLNHLDNEMVGMRKAGWDLPYRYKVENGKRVSA